MFGKLPGGCRPHHARKLLPDAPQPFTKERFVPSQPDAQMPFETHVRAGDNERVLVPAYAFGELDTRDTAGVFKQRDGTRLRLTP